jgi:hypothetical protein
MSPRIPDTHAEAWALLPWLANGRIAPEDREWVDAHVQGCDECRAELAAQRMVASHVTSEEANTPLPASSDEQKSFNKLWARIEAAESINSAAAPEASVSVPQRSSRTVRWLAAAVVVQAIGLGILGVTLRGNSVVPNMHTVTDASPRLDAPAVRLVFSPDASIDSVKTLLVHQGLSIVAGPGDAGNFTAELSVDAVASGASAESVAKVLKKDPHVSFAEPVAQ